MTRRGSRDARGDRRGDRGRGASAPFPGLRRLAGLRWSGPADDDLVAAVAGRLILVTGASSGIGAATAVRLGAAGAHVLLVARRTELLDKVRTRVEAAGGRASTLSADLADPDGAADLAERVLSQHGCPDVVVNNAGKSIRRSFAESTGRFHDITRTHDVNFLGPVRMLMTLLPAMQARGAGHLINVSTIGIDTPGPYWSAYASSKAAFEMWLRCVAPEIRLDGVRATSIHFGLVRTPMSAPTPLFRWMPGMTADEAADAVCRAVVRRPRLMRPWWAGMSVLAGHAAPGTTDLVQSMSHTVATRLSRNPLQVKQNHRTTTDRGPEPGPLTRTCGDGRNATESSA